MHILQSEFFTHDQHFITDHKLTPDPARKQRFQEALAVSRGLANHNPGNPRPSSPRCCATGWNPTIWR